MTSKESAPPAGGFSVFGMEVFVKLRFSGIWGRAKLTQVRQERTGVTQGPAPQTRCASVLQPLQSSRYRLECVVVPLRTRARREHRRRPLVIEVEIPRA